MQPVFWIHDSIRIGCLAARRNFKAGVVLWIFGSLVVAGYYFVTPLREAMEHFAQWKSEWGSVFSMVSTAIFGGLIPSLLAANQTQGSLKRRAFLGSTNVLLWGLKGLEIDWFYRVQALVFGNQPDFWTIVFKTLVDQFVYVPAFGLVNVILFIHWRDNFFSFAKTRSALGPNWYVRHVLPVLVSNWFVWIPAVTLIYSLPVGLQLPIQNLVLVFWILILTFFTNRSSSLASQAETI